MFKTLPHIGAEDRNLMAELQKLHWHVRELRSEFGVIIRLPNWNFTVAYISLFLSLSSSFRSRRILTTTSDSLPSQFGNKLIKTRCRKTWSMHKPHNSVERLYLLLRIATLTVELKLQSYQSESGDISSKTSNVSSRTYVFFLVFGFWPTCREEEPGNLWRTWSESSSNWASLARATEEELAVAISSLICP